MKNFILTSFLLVTFLILSFKNVSAQSQNHEIGLRVYSLEELSFIYKKQKDENKFWRYRMVLGQIGVATVGQGANAANISAGLAFGIEKRKPLNNKLMFVHGWEPALYLGFGAAGDIYTGSINPSIGYVLGFQYNINSSFYMNLETIPALSTQLVSSGEVTTFSASFGFNSSSVALTLAYRFATE